VINKLINIWAYGFLSLSSLRLEVIEGIIVNTFC